MSKYKFTTPEEREHKRDGGASILSDKESVDLCIAIIHSAAVDYVKTKAKMVKAKDTENDRHTNRDAERFFLESPVTVLLPSGDGKAFLKILDKEAEKLANTGTCDVKGV